MHKKRTITKKPDKRTPAETHRVVLIALVLAILTFAVFSRVLGNGFIEFDDGAYVVANPHVQQGITMDSLRWAFNVGYSSNWHPLTWISHIVDYRLFGPNPMGHHLTSLIFHVLNTVLLFLVLRRMTGSTWRSGFVAGLFAVHPLHVESVAWVAERKDVLSTFFWLLTMGAYVLYAEKPGVKRYLPVVGLYALGLMAKPMLVTLPLVLLLLDYWPLKRDRRWQGLLLEKTPLLALSAGSCVITFVAQASKGSMGSLEQLGASTRISNALAGYTAYLWKMLWPSNLAVLYPHPTTTLAVWKAAASAILLIAVSAGVFYLRRRRPYLAVGWLWFLGTLVPVIGLVQVGTQAIADRYTYVPLIGLFIAVVWMIASYSPAGRIAPAAGTVILLVLAVLTYKQLGYWRTSITLFEHTLACTSRNYVIENTLGVDLSKEGRLSEAIEHHEASLRIAPGYAHAHNNLGSILQGQGKLDQAAAHYEAALRDRPDSIVAHTNYGVLLATQGKVDKAISHLMRALELDPDEPRAHFNLGLIYQNQGKISAALSEYRKCARAHSKNVNAYLIPADLLLQRGEIDEAVSLYRQALAIDPSCEKAKHALERLEGS